MKYSIPEGLSREALVDIHTEFLDLNPEIRVNHRWGDYTEYSVRIRAKDASKLLDDDADKDRTYRLCFGVSDPDDSGERDDTVDVQVNVDGEWISDVYDSRTNTMLASATHLLRETQLFLAERYPVAKALLDIDRRLLDLK